MRTLLEQEEQQKAENKIYQMQQLLLKLMKEDLILINSRIRQAISNMKETKLFKKLKSPEIKFTSKETVN